MKILTATKDYMGYHYDIEVAEDDVRHFDWGLDVPQASQMREMALLCQPSALIEGESLVRFVGKTLPEAK